MIIQTSGGDIPHSDTEGGVGVVSDATDMCDSGNFISKWSGYSGIESEFPSAIPILRLHVCESGISEQVHRTESKQRVPDIGLDGQDISTITAISAVGIKSKHSTEGELVIEVIADLGSDADSGRLGVGI